jgi:hypothetical protein
MADMLARLASARHCSSAAAGYARDQHPTDAERNRNPRASNASDRVVSEKPEGASHPHFSASIHFRTFSSLILQVLISRGLVRGSSHALNLQDSSLRAHKRESGCRCIRNKGFWQFGRPRRINFSRALSLQHMHCLREIPRWHPSARKTEVALRTPPRSR